MSDFIRCFVGMFAVIAPFGALASLRASGAARPNPWVRAPFMTPLAAFAVLATAAALNDPLLDWLKISPETFQFAAAAAMAPLAARLILAGNSMPPIDSPTRYAWLVPFAVPLLAGPSSIIAVVSYAARFSIADAVLASAIVLIATAGLFAALDRFEKIPLVILTTLARLSGGLLVLIAIEMAIDGVHSV